ncbi:MAG: hypothetical protein PWP23_995 [Candidatus Sumerlaeota bacterium]|nr:hypothetical protein [Candidatus Sumerlaeota bacterium]
MTVARHGKLQGRRAFTLVEMLIVGALIALFAGMAIFGVQQQFRSNQRKAVIGETRQLATALDFAYNDIGLFPKIAFLQNSITTLRIESTREFGNQDAIFGDFQTHGIASGLQALLIPEKWDGPYFSASQSRTRVSQGRGGSRSMQVPNLPTNSFGSNGFSWPVDTFNNPYMLYCLSIDPDSGGLYFTTETAVTDPNSGSTTLVDNLTDASATGNAFNAVVSYGPNQVPGGGEYANIPGNPADPPGLGTPYGLRLYTGNPADESTPLLLLGPGLLRGNEGATRANVWGVSYANNAGTSTAGFAQDDNGTTPVGITDVGSDDVVFTF